ncbi:hypothetical protein GQ54DRAFT_40862 [Martensiomyces pterosporus]|nr:hypothetical protein GQ54DRAFT_40862 [Martensiomyces pterosporus]
MPDPVPSELKVADLRKELAARNLSTKGLKKELVERLEQALNSADGATPQPSSNGDDQIDLAPADEVAVEADVAEDTVADDARMEEDERVDEAVANEAPDEADASMAEESAAAEEAPAADRKRKLEDGDENNADVAETSNGQAEQPQGTKDSNDMATKAAADSTETKGEPFDAIYIKNLERPLTVYRMRELLEKYGTVKELWLNSIKTRGYVQYSSADEAAAAFNEVNGVKFPPEHGKNLECGFISGDRLMQLIDEEESLRDSVRNIDLVSVPAEGGNCGVALMNPKAKPRNPAKKQKAEKTEAKEIKEAKETKAGKNAADKTVSIVAAAATAAANDAKDTAKEAPAALKARLGSAPSLTKIEREALNRKTKTKPVITYRPLTDKEVAENRAKAAATAAQGSS